MSKVRIILHYAVFAVLAFLICRVLQIRSGYSVLIAVAASFSTFAYDWFYLKFFRPWRASYYSGMDKGSWDRLESEDKKKGSAAASLASHSAWFVFGSAFMAFVAYMAEMAELPRCVIFGVLCGCYFEYENIMREKMLPFFDSRAKCNQGSGDVC